MNKNLIKVLVSITVFFAFFAGNSYLNTTNPNITWLDKDAVRKRVEIPTNFSFQDGKYLYCYGYKKGKEEYPVFYKIKISDWTIEQNSLEYATEKYDYISTILWTKLKGWIFTVDNFRKDDKVFNATEVRFDNVKNTSHLFDISLEARTSMVSHGYGFNNDSTTVTFYSTMYNKKDDRVTFYASCFDFKTMKKIWSNQYLFPHEIDKKNEAGMRLKINKYGEPQFLIKVYFTDNKKEKTRNSQGDKVANYMYNFVVLKKNGKIEEYKIDTKNEFISSISFPIANTKNPIVCYYTFDGKKTLKGLMVKEIDLDNKEVKDVQKIIFNTKKLTYTNEETGVEVKQRDAFESTENLIINQIIYEGNSYYILGENEYHYQICTTNKYGTTCTPWVISGNILVTKVNRDGTEAWSKIIPKSQQIHDFTGLNSYKAFGEGGKIHLFYNDKKSNYEEDIKRIKVWKNKGNTCFVHTEVSDDGNVNSKVALTDDDMPGATKIHTIHKIDGNYIFFFNKKSLGKLKYQ